MTVHTAAGWAPSSRLSWLPTELSYTRGSAPSYSFLVPKEASVLLGEGHSLWALGPLAHTLSIHSHCSLPLWSFCLSDHLGHILTGGQWLAVAPALPHPFLSTGLVWREDPWPGSWRPGFSVLAVWPPGMGARSSWRPSFSMRGTVLSTCQASLCSGRGRRHYFKPMLAPGLQNDPLTHLGKVASRGGEGVRDPSLRWAVDSGEAELPSDQAGVPCRAALGCGG